VDDFKMPTAGKTGTTQNWADAWTVGYTPYYTTAIWLGFDQGGGNSLGTNQTGAVTTGPVWARYMEAIHEGLEPREFDKPATGLTETTVTAKRGLLPPEDYQGETVEEVFLEGTAPETFDPWQDYRNDQESLLVNRLEQTIQEERYSLDTSELSQAEQGELDLDLKLDVDLSQFQGELDSPDGSSQEGNPLLD
jgi:penicillin-binding protein 1A